MPVTPALLDRVKAALTDADNASFVDGDPDVKPWFEDPVKGLVSEVEVEEFRKALLQSCEGDAELVADVNALFGGADEATYAARAKELRMAAIAGYTEGKAARTPTVPVVPAPVDAALLGRVKEALTDADNASFVDGDPDVKPWFEDPVKGLVSEVEVEEFRKALLQSCEGDVELVADVNALFGGADEATYAARAKELRTAAVAGYTEGKAARAPTVPVVPAPVDAALLDRVKAALTDAENASFVDGAADVKLWFEEPFKGLVSEVEVEEFRKALLQSCEGDAGLVADVNALFGGADGATYAARAQELRMAAVAGYTEGKAARTVAAAAPVAAPDPIKEITGLMRDYLASDKKIGDVLTSEVDAVAKADAFIAAVKALDGLDENTSDRIQAIYELQDTDEKKIEFSTKLKTALQTEKIHQSFLKIDNAIMLNKLSEAQYKEIEALNLDDVHDSFDKIKSRFGEQDAILQSVFESLPNNSEKSKYLKGLQNRITNTYLKFALAMQEQQNKRLEALTQEWKGQRKTGAETKTATLQFQAHIKAEMGTEITAADRLKINELEKIVANAETILPELSVKKVTKDLSSITFQRPGYAPYTMYSGNETKGGGTRVSATGNSPDTEGMVESLKVGRAAGTEFTITSAANVDVAFEIIKQLMQDPAMKPKVVDRALLEKMEKSDKPNHKELWAQYKAGVAPTTEVKPGH